MFKKLITGAVIVLAVVVAFMGVKIYKPLQLLSGYSPTNEGGLYLTPSSANGDTYTLAYGTSPFAAAVATLINISGQWAYQINTTSTAHVGLFVQGGASTVLATSTTVTGAQLCSSSNLSVAGTPSAATVTFPTAASTTAAGCMSSDGDTLTFGILQNSTNTIILASSTGDTMLATFTSATSTASFTLASATPVSAIVDILRVNSSSYTYFVNTYR